MQLARCDFVDGTYLLEILLIYLPSSLVQQVPRRLTYTNSRVSRECLRTAHTSARGGSTNVLLVPYLPYSTPLCRAGGGEGGWEETRAVQLGRAKVFLREIVIQQLERARHAFYEALAAGCIPVVISDQIPLPIRDALDWNRAIVRQRQRDHASQS